MQHPEHVGGTKNNDRLQRSIGAAAGMSASASLPGELNSFFARFETSQAGEAQRDQEPETCPLVLNRADVCKSFKRVNPNKAPGPDGIPGRVTLHYL